MELNLPDAAVRLHVDAWDWRDAVRQAGEALSAAGVTDPSYTHEMITVVETLGPYIVIAPGIALAHARPSQAVHRAGCSWVTLARPVAFGNADNDPVSIVVGLAAVDHDGHVDMMAALAAVLADPDKMSLAMQATTAAQLREALKNPDGNTQEKDKQ